MERINITSRLGYLASKYDYTTVCDDFKNVFVPTDCPEAGAKYGEAVQRQLEVINAVDYTKDEVLSKYDKNAKVIKWMDAYTEDGKHETMLVVLDKCQGE